jgi:hypothetical protein
MASTLLHLRMVKQRCHLLVRVPYSYKLMVVARLPPHIVWLLTSLYHVAEQLLLCLYSNSNHS